MGEGSIVTRVLSWVFNHCDISPSISVDTLYHFCIGFGLLVSSMHRFRPIQCKLHIPLQKGIHFSKERRKACVSSTVETCETLGL